MLVWPTVLAQSLTERAPELVLQSGPGSIYTIALSPNGRILASAGLGSAIKLWDAVKGRELRTLVADADFIYSIAFSSDGRMLASGDVGAGVANKAVEVWDITTGKRVQRLAGHSDKVVAVAFSPDGRTLASASWDKTIKIWDVVTGKELRTLRDQAGIWSKALSVGVGMATGKPLPMPKDRSSAAWSIAFSPDGQMLATGSNDNAIRLWDPQRGKKLRTLEGHSDYVASVAFSPSGRLLASGSVDGTIKLWDPTKGKYLRTLRGHRKSVNSVSFSPNGRMLVSGSFDTAIKIWEVETGSELRTLTGHTQSIHATVFYPDGRTLASGGEDSKIKLWDVATGIELRSLVAHSEGVFAVAFSPDGKMLVNGLGPAFNQDSNNERTVKLWSLSGREMRTLSGHNSAVLSAAFSSSGRVVASAGWDKAIKLWDPSTGRELRTLIGHTHWINSIAFSPDGRIIASGSGGPEEPVTGFTFSGDNSIRLWDVETGRLLRTLGGLSIPVSALAFSPDGASLASAGNSLILNSIKPQYDTERCTIKLWDVASGTESGSFRGHKLPVRALAFSPNGRLLVSAGYDDVIKLWDVKAGTELSSIAANPTINSLAFSPDGRIFASASSDRTIKLRESTTGREIRTLNGHSSIVESVAFSRDGQLLASGSTDGTSRLWSVETGKEIGTLIAIDQNDWLIVTPDGLFDGSPEAWRQMLWRFSQNTFDVLSVEAFFNEFYYPGLLSDILIGKRPRAKADIAQLDRRQPELKLSASGLSAEPITARNVRVKINISNAPAGVRDVRFFRNGSLVRVWRGDVPLDMNGKAELEATIPIVVGENRLTAYAFNRNNIKSEDATLSVTGGESLTRKGTAYILAVGVNRYANQQYNLKYAVPDAQLFGQELRRQQIKLGNFANVEVIPLLNEDATRANFLLALSRLSGSETGPLPTAVPALGKIKPAQPEDAVVVYFAGHGTAQKSQFYLIPHDLGYAGARTELDESGLRAILEHSISDRELEQAFAGVDAKYLLLIIDACNSGQALESEEKRRGPMNSKGLAQLAYEKGMYILTAAQSYQAALEAEHLGHGYLTYVLTEEGLKTGAADRSPRDSQVTVREWLDYATERVPLMQQETRPKTSQMQQGSPKKTQQPGVQPKGKASARKGQPARRQKTQPKDREMVIVQNSAAPVAVGESEAQRPRVFYRRELEPRPLIVARPQQ